MAGGMPYYPNNSQASMTAGISTAASKSGPAQPHQHGKLTEWLGDDRAAEAGDHRYNAENRAEISMSMAGSFY
jgi:hypothetical protein